MQTPTAKLIEEGSRIIVKTSAFNADFVAEIKRIDGKRPVLVNGKFDAWSLPVELEQEVREIARRYFQIEGEESKVEYEILRLRVTGESSSSRNYQGGVSIDGHDLIDTMRGGMRTSPNFEILSSQGGFTHGDGYINLKRTSSHAFSVEYIVEVKVRKGAKIEATGRASHWGSFEILDNAEETLESSEDSRSSLEGSVLDFGKYEGSTLNDVPPAYLRWLIAHVNVLTKEHQQFVNDNVKAFLSQDEIQLAKAA